MLLTLALMGIIPALVARMYLVPSGSMEQTLHGCKGCDNDRVLVDRLVYRFKKPSPGDVIVFVAGPDVWTNSEVENVGEANPFVRKLESLGSRVGIHFPAGTDFIKRVIAVGGQTVSCCDQRNRVIVDGVALDEPYVYFSPEAGNAQQQSFGPVRVPEGQLFVMGDNRNDSLDSRAPGNGPIPLSAVAGKARFIVFPFHRIGLINSTNPQSRPSGQH
ncbi:MAG: signal peptidase I [Pseudonocardia sp.]|nr:signal peptidase I [Pseudonocardia sp.]